METAPPRPVAGVLWMMATGIMFVCVTGIVKYIGDDVPAAQSGFLRYLLGLVFLIPMIRPILAARLSRRQLAIFSGRGLIHTVAVIFWFYAMARIPIADVTAMNYLSPIYVSVGAALLMGESLPPRRIAAVFVAFIGALIILRPGVREISPGHIAMIFTAIGFAGSYLFGKQMAGEVSPAVVVGMLSITVTIGLAPFAYAVWVPVSWENVALLFVVACFATAGHYAMTLAFSAAPLTVTQPVTYLQLVWAILLGVLVFGEGVDVLVIVGALIIMAAVSFITWREAVARRKERPT